MGSRAAIGVVRARAGYVARPAGRSPGAVLTVARRLQLNRSAYLKGSNTEAGDHSGAAACSMGTPDTESAISGDGNTLAVGAPHESGRARASTATRTTTPRYDAGAVYVFTRNGADWAQQAYVKASNPQGATTSATPSR